MFKTWILSWVILYYPINAVVVVTERIAEQPDRGYCNLSETEKDGENREDQCGYYLHAEHSQIHIPITIYYAVVQQLWTTIMIQCEV